jgi:hypothetical protein
MFLDKRLQKMPIVQEETQEDLDRDALLTQEENELNEKYVKYISTAHEKIRMLHSDLEMSDKDIEKKIYEMQNLIANEGEDMIGDYEYALQSLDQMEKILELLQLQQDLSKIIAEKIDVDIDAIDIEQKHFQDLLRKAKVRYDYQSADYSQLQKDCKQALRNISEYYTKRIVEMQMNVDAASIGPLAKKVYAEYKGLEDQFHFLKKIRADITMNEERIEDHKPHRMGFIKKLADEKQKIEHYEGLLDMTRNILTYLDMYVMEYGNYEETPEDIYDGYESEY